jgi:uncharacterized phage protein gp47/JayE
MAIWERPTFETLLQRVLSKIDDKRSGAATGPGSDADILSYTLAHIGHGLYLMQEYGLLHNLIYTKASGWILDAYLWGFGLSDGSGGFGRIKARGSYADDSFTFVALGGPGWVDLDGYTFSDTAGNQYEIDESYTPAGAGTSPPLRVIGIGWDGDNGADTNVEVAQGEVFTWDTTPPQMDSTITQVVDLDHGANRETDGEGRARLVKHLQTAAMGGNWAHWREVAEEADPGNVDCFVYYGIHDEAYGYGCTNVACLQRGEHGADREIQDGDDLHQTIEDALEDALPWGTFYRARLLDTTAVVQDVELSIKINDTARDADRCDFDARALDQSGGLVVNSYSEPNKTISPNQDINNDIEVGDRVIINSAQAVVSKVGIADGLGDDRTFEVATWFEIEDDELNPYPWANGYNPTGDHVLSGGGRILDCITGLRNLFARLGTSKGNNAASIPGWEDQLRLQRIEATMIEAGDEAGDAVIYDTDVTTPATDTSPTAGSGTDTYFLAAGELIVWEDKT